MESDYKVLRILILAVTVVALSFVGWGLLNTKTDHDFAVRCVESGKSIKYRTIEGSDRVVRECV